MNLLEFIQTIGVKAKQLDYKIYHPLFTNSVLKSEADRLKKLNNWLPLPIKVYCFFNRSYAIPPDDYTIPNEYVYNVFYKKRFNNKQSLLIAKVLLNYAKSNSELSLALIELKNCRTLGSYGRKILMEVKQNMDRTGTPLYKALEEGFGSNIDPLLIDALKTGDITNRIVELLQNYVDDLEYDIRNNAKIKKALAYPVLILVMLVAVCLACKYFLYDALFTGVELERRPSEFDIPFAVSAIVTNPIKLLLTYIVYRCFKFIKNHSQTLRVIIETILLRLPGIGKFLITKDLCYFFRHLYHYIDVGTPTTEAHIQALNIIKLETLRIIFNDKTDFLIKGNLLTEGYKTITYLSDAIKLELTSAEHNGTLKDALFNVQATLRIDYQEATDNLISQIPNYSIIVVGIILCIVILPIYSLLMNIDKFIM